MAAAVPVAPTLPEFLENSCGVTNATTRNHIVAAGFDDWDTLVDKNDEYSHQICQTIRKYRVPANQAATIRISQRMENYMRSGLIWSRFSYATSRPVNANAPAPNGIEMATMATLASWYDQLEKDAAPLAEPFTDSCNKRHWLESIQNDVAHLHSPSSGFPLSYVIRTDNAPANPLPTGYVLLPDGTQVQDANQFDWEADLAANGRHDGHFWRADNKKVWDYIYRLTHRTNCWGTVVRFQRTSNGRGAYLALQSVFLGRNVQASIAAVAERKLHSIRFDGRSRNYTFDRFTSQLRELWRDLGPDNQPSEDVKVRKLLSSYRAPNHLVITSVILSDPVKAFDFEAAVVAVGEDWRRIRMGFNDRREVSGNKRAKGKSKDESSNKESKDGSDVDSHQGSDGDGTDDQSYHGSDGNRTDDESHQGSDGPDEERITALATKIVEAVKDNFKLHKRKRDGTTSSVGDGLEELVVEILLEQDVLP